MRQKLFVDGVDLSTYGVYISGDGTFSAAEKNYTFNTVPNRNETVLGLVRDLEDIDVSYSCFICSNFDANARDLRNFLLSRSGWVKINDTYHTTEYRMGGYLGPFEPTITKTLDAGTFVLTFRCHPQRWLVSGDIPVSLERVGNTQQNKYINNPTYFEALPILRIFGTGTIGYGNIDIIIDNAVASLGYSYIDIDCEKMTCTNSGVNLSGYVTVKQSSFAEGFGRDLLPLLPGNNNFLFPANTGITKVEVTPRWWVM